MTFSEELWKTNGLVMNFGAPELLMELDQLIDEPRLSEAVAEYGRLHALTEEEHAGLPEGLRARIQPEPVRSSDSRLTGWAAARAGDTDLARRALDLLDRKWGQVAVDPAERLPPIGSVPTPFPRKDPRNHFTNATSQWALSVIALLELVPEAVEAAYASRDGLPPTDS
jgi:hypothetical protein